MSEKKTEFTIKEDGFHGNLFECQSENNPYPKKILIICSGSDGDFENSKSTAKKISDKGINSLALGYFNIPDGPSILKETPIDYIGEAANYLKSIGYEKIGLWGISMGSIYVLLGASYYPDLINLVIAASPCYFVVQAMDSQKNILYDTSAYSYHHESIPYEPYTENMTMFRNIFESIKHLEPNFSYLYTSLIGHVPKEHIIPFEKMKAHILLFSGKLDSIWPSYEFSNIIVNHLKEINYSYPYEHIICEYGGHLMVPFPTKLDKFFKANRKYKNETEQYRKEHIEKIIETFKTL
ncbi:alpha/beta-hydrolase [Anaeromyces robustus]|uniref:Alpha/beta-hydrolase n=1 Tax=Anaeromyces robustus TaxID=1754192 RepID=A0A1Y1WE03_9FUNG|nr:alpha/beta-hydrolase [Anaeromyces robustus]|eukprot:ORX71747.1 alpha/beta-hydrolase [Anaeromyces robustus]